LSSPVPVPAGTVIQDATNATSPAHPPASVSSDRTDQNTASKQEVTASPAAQVAPLANTTKIALPRKRTETATSTAETKRDQQSLVARVQAALASVDGNRTGSLAVPPQDAVRLDPAGAASQVRPSTDSIRSAVPGAVPPNTVELGSLPAQQTQPNPLPAAVEIQSRPVAAVQSSPPPPVEKETGIISDLEQMLRHDPLAGEEAPRPPMPVGQ
jgi:hypothetical protein